MSHEFDVAVSPPLDSDPTDPTDPQPRADRDPPRPFFCMSRAARYPRKCKRITTYSPTSKRIPVAAAKSKPMLTVSETHAYEDADVRIVVGDTAFLVHTLFLKRNSEYFEACFRGPWDETTVNAEGDSSLRQVLDWIYRTDLFLDPEQTFALVNIADRFQVGNLLAFLNHLAPPPLTWENIEKWLNIATEGTRRFEQCIKSCTDLLQNAQASLWIRALYLAEKHNLGSLHGAENNHVYDDADVRIVVGNTAFLVHTLVLKLKSEYLEACFRGPWTENTEVIDGRTLRQVTLNDVDPKEFSQLLDWMYGPSFVSTL
ncbi:Kelch-like protein 22 [Geranomyces variabilis]|nr:Kelch-like protein 22 [Geranomyces variabilis]